MCVREIARKRKRERNCIRGRNYEEERKKRRRSRKREKEKKRELKRERIISKMISSIHFLSNISLMLTTVHPSNFQI